MEDSQSRRGTHILSSDRAQSKNLSEESIVIERKRGTHRLSSAEGKTNEDSGRKLAGEGHSPSVECREDLIRMVKERVG